MSKQKKQPEASKEVKPIAKADFNKLLKAAVNTPPPKKEKK
jgi:hypothetical protein